MEIVSRKEAKSKGLTYYYTGTKCCRDHCSPRLVSTRGCVSCVKEHHKKRDNRYLVWKGMEYRCTDENAPNYHQYGYKGISICDRWLDPQFGFENFCADMGPRPAGYTLDRINPFGNYHPDNCRWASKLEQERNKRATRISYSQTFEVFRLLDLGTTQAKIAEKFGCTQGNIALLKRNRHLYEATASGSTQTAL